MEGLLYDKQYTFTESNFPPTVTRPTNFWGQEKCMAFQACDFDFPVTENLRPILKA